MANLKSIGLTFENCECMTIPANVIGPVHITGIHDEVHRLTSNYIGKFTIASEIAIEIFSEGNVKYVPFEIEEYESHTTDVFSRITTFEDITHVQLEYDDGSKDEYAVDYDEGGKEGSLGAPNINQKTYLSKQGNLYLVIAAAKNIEDYFDMDNINDENIIKFRKDMWDIGIEEEEEHEISNDCLPEMYRYVYLRDESTDSLAIRVPSENGDWMFVYVYEHDVVHFPKKWIYPKSNIDEFLREEYKGGPYSIESLKKKYSSVVLPTQEE